MIWKTIAGKTLDADMAKLLLSEGRVSKQAGFKKKDGTEFEAGLKLSEGKVVLAWD